jgi:hypothetical protein
MVSIRSASAAAVAARDLKHFNGRSNSLPPFAVSNLKWRKIDAIGGGADRGSLSLQSSFAKTTSFDLLRISLCQAML